MALGGFKRAFETDGNGIVTSHMPLNSPNVDPSWTVTDVPKNIPADLNTLMRDGALSIKSGKLVVDPAWVPAPPMKPAKPESEKIRKVLIKKGLLTQADIDAEG